MIRTALKELPDHRTVLDLGCGTAGLLFDLCRADRNIPRERSFIGLDFSKTMLQEAKVGLRRIREEERGRIYFLQAGAGEIPLQSSSVDLVVSAFVTRNVRQIIHEVLSEVNRVLRPGGTVLLLEMYMAKGKLARLLQKIYLNSFLEIIGRILFGRSWPGSYLSETITRFWSPDRFSGMLTEHSFKEVRAEPLNFGIAAVHRARKSS